MAMNVTVDTLLDRVKDIAPILRAYAAEAEAQRRLARPVVDAMLQAGLYSMSHPKAFGGLEVDPLTMFRVVEYVAYQDSAAGWNMQMSVGASCFLAWLPDEGAAEILTRCPFRKSYASTFRSGQGVKLGAWCHLTRFMAVLWTLYLAVALSRQSGQPEVATLPKTNVGPSDHMKITH
jgi:hypothetical protein